MTNRALKLFALSLATVLVVAGGCQTATVQQGLLERQSEDAKLSSRQLRVMVNEFAIHFTDRVEVTADQVLATASDPSIRRNALLWKINATSACFQAASRPDALAAYLDVWILNRQMTQYLESPVGRTSFGPGQSLVLEQCHAFERRLQGIDRSVGGEMRFGEKFVAKFAGDFPVHSLYFDREPIASRYIEEVREPPSELMHVVGNLDESITELRQLGTVYAKHLPKQARWEAELFLINSAQLEVVQRPLQELSMSAAAVAQLARVGAAAPALLERERLALGAIVADERTQTLKEVERMRLATLVDLQNERSLVLQAVQEQRAAITQDLHHEVSAMLNAADVMTHRRTAEVVQQAPGLIDHFYWRGFQLFAFAAMLAVPAWWWSLNGGRRQVQHLGEPTLSDAMDQPIAVYSEGELKIAA
jgi:hypothetical protein